MDEAKIIYAATCIVQRADGAVLLQQRTAGQSYAGYWEFPGGKVMAGERAEDAARRELDEEVGLAAGQLRKFVRRRWTRDNGNMVVVDFFVAEGYRGVARSCEQQKIRWALLSDLPAPLLPANVQICHWLQLPPFCIITAAEHLGEQRMLSCIQSHLSKNHAVNNSFNHAASDEVNHAVNDAANNLVNNAVNNAASNAVNHEVNDAVNNLASDAVNNSAVNDSANRSAPSIRSINSARHCVVLRDKTLARRAAFAAKLRVQCQQHGALLFVADDETLAAQVDGLHLSAAALLSCTARPALAWVGASCHNAAELNHARKLGLDYAFLSPVCRTRSHADAVPLGWQQFAALSQESGLPIYALGGLGEQHLTIARNHFAHGVAFMRQAWQASSSPS